MAAAGGLSATASAQPVSQVRTLSVAHAASALTLREGSFSAHPLRPLASAGKKHHKRLTPRQIARSIMHRFRWKINHQFKYLNWLWERESSWNKYATNPYSGAYGIPQAVPGSKMASCGRDWRTNAKTQIRWGMRYIKAIYRFPRRAWAHEVSYGWY
jgi:hypothetical protein